MAPYPASWLPPDTGDLLLLIERSRNDTGAFSDLDLGRSYSFHLEACTTIPDTPMERKAQPTLTSSYHCRWDCNDVSEANLEVPVPAELLVNTAA